MDHRHDRLDPDQDLATRTAVSRRGSLIIVGTGIRAGAQLTSESLHAFQQADVAFYLVADRVATKWLQELNPDSRSLHDLYREGVPRQEIYDRIVETILSGVRAGRNVCAAFYGHPGVFVYPSHEAVRRAREEGFRARMLPAVSAEDCLFADLGVDPGSTGCQSYEATDFLLRRRQIDPTAALILWQVSVIGERVYSTAPPRRRLAALVDYLGGWYPARHSVTLYEASPYPIAEPLIQSLTLEELPEAQPTPLATLYIPPIGPREPDLEMAARLGLALP